jgi:hypothetical protein
MNEDKLSERAKEINLALESEIKLKFLESENVELNSFLVNNIKRLNFFRSRQIESNSTFYF